MSDISFPKRGPLMAGKGACLILVLRFCLPTPLLLAEELPTETRKNNVLPDEKTRSELDLAIGEQWKKFYEEGRQPSLDPLQVYGDRLVTLAHEAPSDERSLLATDFLLRYGNGVTGDESHRLMMEGMRAALRRHRDNAHLVAVLKHVGDGGTPEREVETFLRDLLRDSKNPTIRAGTAFALARLLDSLSYIRAHLDEYTVRLRAAFPEHGPQLDDLETYLADRNPLDMRREAAQLLRMIIEKYPEKQPMIRKNVARMGFDAQFYQDSDRPNYGVLASRLLFAVENLREGCMASEIVGKDTSGQSFQLSDYRGKVVLLMFSFRSCAACRSWYPINRKLVEHFEGQPFAVLGVWNSFGVDDTLDALRDSIEEGETTWRCWWDGQDGTISTHWDVHGWPTLYLIDGRGVIRRRHPPREFDELKKTIAILMAELHDGDQPEP